MLKIFLWGIVVGFGIPLLGLGAFLYCEFLISWYVFFGISEYLATPFSVFIIILMILIMVAICGNHYEEKYS